MAEGVVAGSLVYQFKADLTALRSGMTQVRQQLAGLANQARGASGEMARGMESATRATQQLSSQMTISAAVMRGALVGVVRQFAHDFPNAVRQALDDMRRLETASRQLVSNPASLRTFSQAAGVFGVDPARAIQELQGLAVKLREAQVEGGKLAEGLSRIGINVKAFDLSKPGEFARLFEQIAEKVRDGSNEIDKLNAVRLLGLSDEFTRVFQDGLGDVRRFASESASAVDDGTREMIAKYEEFNRIMNDIWKSIRDGFVKYFLEIKEFAFGVANSIANAVEKITLGRIKNDLAGASGPRIVPIGAGESSADHSMSDLRARGGVNLSGLFGTRGGGGGGASHAAREAKSAVESYIESLRQAEATAKAEAENWKLGNVEREKAVALAKAEELARREGKTLSDAQRSSIISSAEAGARYKESVNEMRDAQQRLNSTVREFSSIASSALEDLILRGGKAKDVLAELAKSIGATLLRRGTDNIIDSILGKFGGGGGAGGGGGLFGGLLKSLPSFAGLFAEGGTIPAGKWGIVGERGPEMISGPAAVTPMGGGFDGSPNVMVHNYAAGVEVTPRVSRGEVALIVREIGGAMIDANNRNLPGIMFDRRRRSP